jgi:hypothetical protein
MCLPSRCLVIDIYSDFSISAFGRHVTIYCYCAVSKEIYSEDDKHLQLDEFHRRGQFMRPQRNTRCLTTHLRKGSWIHLQPRKFHCSIWRRKMKLKLSAACLIFSPLFTDLVYRREAIFLISWKKNFERKKSLNEIPDLCDFCGGQSPYGE